MASSRPPLWFPKATPPRRINPAHGPRYRRNPAADQLQGIMSELLYRDAATVQEALNTRMTRDDLRTKISAAQQFHKYIYFLNNAKKLVKENKITLADLDSAAAFKVWLKSGVDPAEASEYIISNLPAFLTDLDASAGGRSVEETRFLYYIFTEGLAPKSEGTKPLPVAVDAINRGEIILAAYCQLALQFEELRGSPALSERGVLDVLRGSKSVPPGQEQSTPDVEPEPEAEAEPEPEAEPAGSESQSAEEPEAESSPPPRTQAPVPPEATALFEKLKAKYEPLRTAWKRYLALLQAEKNSPEVPLRDAYVQFVTARNTYLAEMGKIREEATKQRVSRALGEIIAAVDAPFSQRYAESLRERTGDARRRKYQEAGAAPLMATGLPLVQPQPSNEANARVARQVERDLRIRAISLPQEAINVPVVATPARMPQRAGQLATLQAVRSPYRSTTTITVPMRWMDTKKISDINNASVLRLSPDMSYLILYRNGFSVGQYKTTLSPNVGDFYADVMAMITSVLTNESLWRNESPERHTKAIYLIHSGRNKALRLYLGSAGGIASPFSVPSIMASLGAGGGGISLKGKQSVISNIITEDEAKQEASDFALQMASAGIRTYEEPVRVSASSFAAGATTQGPAAEEKKEKAIFIFTSAYEQGDELEYGKFCDALLDSQLNIKSFVVPTPIKPEEWLKLQVTQQNIKDDFRFLAFLLDRAKNERKSIPTNLISISPGGVSTKNVTDTVVTLRTAPAAPGVPHIYLPLAGDPNVNNDGLTVALKSAIRNGAMQLFLVSSNNVRVDVNRAQQNILSQVVQASGVNPKTKLTDGSKSRIRDAVLSLLGYEAPESEILQTEVTSGRGDNYGTILHAVTSAVQTVKIHTINADDLVNQLISHLRPLTNPMRLPLRNDGRRRRIEYVARTFQRVTS